jgi:hypothetical protein
MKINESHPTQFDVLAMAQSVDFIGDASHPSCVEQRQPTAHVHEIPGLLSIQKDSNRCKEQLEMHFKNL